MLTIHEEGALPVQIACLESQLQQIAEEWNQLGQWLDSDQKLLAAARMHTESVRGSLSASGPIDRQVQNALTELMVMSHVQQFLLEQTIQYEARARSRLEEEQNEVQQTLTRLQQR
jgi:hypothetical protein